MNYTCANCGSHTVERVILEAYQYEGLGIPVLISRSAIRTTCKNCGQHSHTIPDLSGLKAAVAISTVLDPSKLTTRKIRFLRKAMNLKAHELAAKLGTRPETMSRVEREHIDLSHPLDLKLRMLVIDSLRAKAPGVDIDVSALAKMANTVPQVASQHDALVWFEQVKVKEAGREYARRLWDRDVNHQQEAA